MSEAAGTQLRLDGTGGDLPAGKPKSKCKRRGAETAMQIQIVQWARKQAAQYEALNWLFHVPNEGRRTPQAAAVLQRAGLTKGISDLCLPYPACGYHGMFLELKTGRNKPTKQQQAFLDYAKSAGYLAAVCYDAPTAKTLIHDYITGALDGPAACPF